MVVTKTLDAKAGSIFNFFKETELKFQTILQQSYLKSLKHQLTKKDLIFEP